MKQGKVKNTGHKPNIGLYLKMLFGSMAILLILFFIPQSSVFFSIISGVGSGCVASVIVAWLIEKSNCDKYNDRDDDIKEHYYMNIKDSMDSLFDEIARLVHEKQPKEISVQRNIGKWFEWVADIQRNKEFRFNVEELNTLLTLFLKVFDEIDKVQDKKLEMSVQEIMTRGDFWDLRELRWVIGALCSSLCYNNIDNYRMMIAIGRLEKRIQENQYLRSLNEKKYRIEI